MYTIKKWSTPETWLCACCPEIKNWEHFVTNFYSNANDHQILFTKTPNASCLYLSQSGFRIISDTCLLKSCLIYCLYYNRYSCSIYRQFVGSMKQYPCLCNSDWHFRKSNAQQCWVHAWFSLFCCNKPKVRAAGGGGVEMQLCGKIRKHKPKHTE